MTANVSGSQNSLSYDSGQTMCVGRQSWEQSRTTRGETSACGVISLHGRRARDLQLLKIFTMLFIWKNQINSHTFTCPSILIIQIAESWALPDSSENRRGQSPTRVVSSGEHATVSNATISRGAAPSPSWWQAHNPVPVLLGATCYTCSMRNTHLP